MQKIIEALNKVGSSVRGIKKDEKGQITKDTSYDYVSGDKTYEALTPVWLEQGLELGKSMVPGTFKITPFVYEKTKPGYQGSPATVKRAVDFMVEFVMEYTWRHKDEPGTELKELWPYVGLQDEDPSKAMGTAATYCDRYYLLKRFNIQTNTDDADNKINLKLAQEKLLNAKKQQQEEYNKAKEIVTKVQTAQQAKAQAQAPVAPVAPTQEVQLEVVQPQLQTALLSQAEASKFGMDLFKQFCLVHELTPAQENVAKFITHINSVLGTNGTKIAEVIKTSGDVTTIKNSLTPQVVM